MTDTTPRRSILLGFVLVAALAGALGALGPGLVPVAVVSAASGSAGSPSVPSAITEAHAAAPDEVRIRAMLEDQYAALLAMDADRYAAHLAEDAVWENALGDRYDGREAIREFNRRVAATMERASYEEGWTVRVSFVTPDVAVADVAAVLRGQQVGGRRLVDRPMLNVYVLRRQPSAEAGWEIAHTRIRDQWELRYAEP